jgi:hypothetical protein
MSSALDYLNTNPDEFVQRYAPPAARRLRFAAGKSRREYLAGKSASHWPRNTREPPADKACRADLQPTQRTTQ